MQLSRQRQLYSKKSCGHARRSPCGRGYGSEAWQPLQPPVRWPVQFREAACTALAADILISTGSTFASALALFAPQHLPLLLEETRHTKHVSDQQTKWFTNPEDAFHLADGELVLHEAPGTGAAGTGSGAHAYAEALEGMRKKLRANANGISSA